MTYSQKTQLRQAKIKITATENCFFLTKVKLRNWPSLVPLAVA